MRKLSTLVFKRFLISVPPNKLKFTFIKSSGPGGQNVNKTNSKAQMVVDLTGEWIKPDIKEYLKVKHPSKVNISTSKLLIQSDVHRSQHQNQQSCTKKLDSILSEAEKACKPAAKPSAEQAKRVEGLKEKFLKENKKEKIGRKEKKASRSMKTTWHDDL